MKQNAMVKIAGWAVVLVLLSGCGDDGGPALDKNGSFKIVPPLSEEILPHIVAQGVPQQVAELGVAKFEQFRHRIRNGSHFSLVDFTQHSSKPRMYTVNVNTGEVTRTVVAHGAGSDPDKNGMPQYFSNVPDSRKSSLGAYLVSEKYYGKFGASMKTDGLESTNNLVRRRTIVLHPSKYVVSGKAKQGMSWGCFAVPYEGISKLIGKLRDGSFLFAFGKSSASNSASDNLTIERILADPLYRWVDESEEAPDEGQY